MAYLDFDGLTRYDGKIKELINGKVDLIDATALTGSSTIADLLALLPEVDTNVYSGLVEFNSLTIHGGYKLDLGISLVKITQPVANIYAIWILGAGDIGLYNGGTNDSTTLSSLGFIQRADTPITTSEINALF